MSKIMDEELKDCLEVKYNNKPCYNIVYNTGFHMLKKELDNLDLKAKKVAIISDDKVAAIYGDELKNVVSQSCSECFIFTFPNGENYKTLDTVKSIYKFLIENHFTRKDFLIALGGGVVGDVTGYAAATYLRGVKFIQVPTTLLSQVDSSIGGKTGVDFDGYKNMVGAFYMPSLVYMNIQTLKTLDDRQFFSGFAEVMKSALLKDEKFYSWLIDHLYEICEKDMDTLKEMIFRTNIIKKIIVEHDPTEKGERALLNLGHTLGHAIEKYMKFTLYHGECVALGCVASAYISWKKGYLSMEEYYEIRDMFVPFNLPISIDNVDCDEVIKLTKSDKKAENNMVKFILLKKIGKAFIDTTVTDEDMLNALNELNFQEED